MSALRRLWLAAGALIGIGVACQPIGEGKGWFPVEGSSFVVSEPRADTDKGDLYVSMFTSRQQCKDEADVVDGADIDLCIPQVDRGSGRLRLGIFLQNKDKTGRRFLRLTNEQVTITHDAQPPYKWEMIPHGSKSASQLYIILIDDTFSVYKTGGMEKIKSALQNKKVEEAFFRKEGSARSGVLLLRFNNEVFPLGGGTLKDLEVLEKPGPYEELIANNLLKPEANAWSHTYEAIGTTFTTVLESPKVQKWITVNNAIPKVILLTDGYNNHEKADACKTNLDRLTDLLKTLKQVREKGGEKKPSLYALGMGEPIFPNFDFRINMKPTVENLCGDYPDQGIDSSWGEGALERFVDNPSLEFIVDAIGGEKPVFNSSEDAIAEMFLKAASKTYSWYELRYEVDPLHMRHSFETRVIVDAAARGESTVTFVGSPWVDAPSGAPSKEDLTFLRSPFLRSLAVVGTLLGLMVTGLYVGPALFNARRALLRRARK